MNLKLRNRFVKFLCTPTGVSKGFMSPECICKIDENGNVIEKYLPYYDALLLENHGALTWSTDLNAAYMKMESLEFYAELSYRTKVLGGAQEFDEENIKRLYEIRRNMNIGGKHPATATPEEAAEAKKLGLPGYQYDFVGTIM